MNTTHARTKFLTAAVGAAIAGAAPALLFLGAGSAHAIQDVSDEFIAPTVQDVSERVPGIVHDHPPLSSIPGSKVWILDPGSKLGLGGPDTHPAPQH